MRKTIFLFCMLLVGCSGSKYDGSCLIPEGVIINLSNVSISIPRSGLVVVSNDQGAELVMALERCAFLKRDANE